MNRHPARITGVAEILRRSACVSEWSFVRSLTLAATPIKAEQTSGYWNQREIKDNAATGETQTFIQVADVHLNATFDL